MEDFSLHILDICENSIKAGAERIEILIEEDSGKDLLTIEINDNGRGMEKEFLDKVLDPFVTTRTERRVGLGLPLIAQSAQMCDGDIEINSILNQGTSVKATFRLSHIDLQPIGDMASTISTLIAGHPEINFYYSHIVNKESFIFDAAETREELEGIPMNHPEVLNLIRNSIKENIQELREKSAENQ